MRPPAEPPALDALLEATWQRLARAVHDRHAAWRTPALATVDATGAPALRTLVLRGVDRAAHCLRLFTDARSAKAAEIAAEPRIALLFWDARHQVQLRATGTASLAPDPAAFAALPAPARALYAVAPPPGTAIASADSFALAGGDGHFRVLTVRLAAFEHLELSTPHRRARFELGAGSATWLVP